MIQTKFPFKCIEYQVVELDWLNMKKAMLHLVEGEILIRKKIEWNYEQMRKYLHGPCTKFMIQQFANIGVAFTVAGMHKWLRDEFLSGIPKEFGGKVIPNPVSSESIGREGYVEWLNSINKWCMDNFRCELPPAEKVE